MHIYLFIYIYIYINIKRPLNKGRSRKEFRRCAADLNICIFQRPRCIIEAALSIKRQLAHHL